MRECSRRAWSQYYLLKHFQASLSYLPVFKFLQGLVHRQFPILHFLLQEDEFFLPSSQAIPHSGKGWTLHPSSVCNIRRGVLRSESMTIWGKKALKNKQLEVSCIYRYMSSCRINQQKFFNEFISKDGCVWHLVLWVKTMCLIMERHKETRRERTEAKVLHCASCGHCQLHVPLVRVTFNYVRKILNIVPATQ